MRKIIVANLVLLVVATAPASAAIRLVPLDYATVQGAIDASADEDTVVVRRGRYCENIDFLGKAITVTSMDPDDPEVVANTVIDANGVGSVVTFANAEGTDAVLTGFTITGGYGTLDTSFGPEVYWGAGIYCRNSSPTIRANVIRDNHAPLGEDGGFGGGGGGYATTGGAEGEEQAEFGLGGGIGCCEASPVITHNIIKDNVAYAGGGIILFMGSEAVANNLIYGNSAGSGGGGGVYLGSEGRVINNTIVGNSSVQGGNILAGPDTDAGELCLIANNIIADSADGHGIRWFGSEGHNAIAYNNFWNNDFGDYYGLPDQTGLNGNISQDPLFVNPGDNDYHLGLDSPCINAGDPKLITEAGQSDIDGDQRVFAVRIDIGADEYVGYLKPVADAGGDQHLDEIQLVTLDGSGSYFDDPNGTKIFQWTQTAGPTVQLSDSAAIQPTFMPEFEDEYRFELVVSDGSNTSAPDEVLIVVGNRPPVADAGPDRVCQVGEQVCLDGTGSYDPDPSDELSYAWRQLDGPDVVLDDANAATACFDCIKEGAYSFELVVSDGLSDSEAAGVEVLTVSVTVDQQDLDFSIQAYNHYGDVSGSKVIFAEGSACDFTWTNDCVDLQTGQHIRFEGGGIDTQPKIDGNLVVWFGGPDFGNPWRHEPSNMSIFVRNLATRDQRTLRKYTMSESYSHPAILGNIVVWLEHLSLDTTPIGSSEANYWWNTPYNVCGADVTDLDNPTYFTIAENVGNRDPYPCHSYSSDFDDVIDISGNIVVWEAKGDIYGADISDLDDIKVFPVCTGTGRQFDPSVSGNIVVWTDQRNDAGDIYGADISNVDNIKPFAIVEQAQAQHQPTIDGRTVVYLEAPSTEQVGEIKICCLARQNAVLAIPLDEPRYGLGPTIDGDTIVWQDDYYGKARGISLEFAYSSSDGPIENLTSGKKYDYIQHAVNDANSGDEIVAGEGVYHENVRIKGQNITVRSKDPQDSTVVAATVISGDGNPAVRFPSGKNTGCLLSGFTITNGSSGIYCDGVNFCDGSDPTISNCVVTGNATAGIHCFSEDPLCPYPTITNCAIVGNQGDGVYIHESRPVIANCTIARNAGAGIYRYYCRLTMPVTNSIIWGNSDQQIGGQHAPRPATVTYSDVQGSWAGLGNIDDDPYFVDAANGDYHLQSQAGRWDPNQNDWVTDANTSPCIDSGNPGSALGDEPSSVSNIRINMGAYGGTAEASITPDAWALLADLSNDGIVDYVDLAGQAKDWLASDSEQPGDLNRNGIVDMIDFAILAEDWLQRVE